MTKTSQSSLDQLSFPQEASQVLTTSSITFPISQVITNPVDTTGFPILNKWYRLIPFFIHNRLAPVPREEEPYEHDTGNGDAEEIDPGSLSAERASGILGGGGVKPATYGSHVSTPFSEVFESCKIGWRWSKNQAYPAMTGPNARPTALNIGVSRGSGLGAAILTLATRAMALPVAISSG